MTSDINSNRDRGPGPLAEPRASEPTVVGAALDGTVAQAPANREPPQKAPRLLDQLRDAIRRLHYSPRTEEAYHHWVKRYIRFCGMRHPEALGRDDLMRFLTHLAVDERVAASTQN